MCAYDDNSGGGLFSRIEDYLYAGITYYIKLSPRNPTGIIQSRITVSIPYLPIDFNGMRDMVVDQSTFMLFKYIPTQTGMHTIYTSSYLNNGSYGDTYLELYSDEYMNNMLDYNDDYNGTRFSSINYYMTAGIPYYIKIMGFNYSEVWTRLQVKTAETYYRFSADGMTMDIKEPREGETNIQALVYSTGSTTGEIYHYSSSGQWNRSFQYAGIPSDIGMASLENGGDISGQSIDFANIIDMGRYQNLLMDSVYGILGFNYINMTSADKSIANLGICMGIVDSIFPNIQSCKILSSSVVKAGLFFLAGTNENQCEKNYFYLKAKTQTEYIIYIASTVTSVGSFAGATASFAAAGIAAASGGTLLIFSGGTGVIGTLVCEIGAAEAAIAGGICIAAGVVATSVASTSGNAFKSDNIKLSSVKNPANLGFANKGSTGRTTPNNLNEHLAMEQVKSNPLAGADELPITMTDSRWLETDGWVKMQNVVNLSDGTKINIHFVYNKILNLVDDFKFK